MTKTVLGIIGGSGVYDIDGPGERPLGARRLALGRALGRTAVRHARRRRHGVPAAPRARPHPFADLDQLPRQYRRAEARRRHRHHFGLGLRLVPRGAAARHLRARRPVHRPHACAREDASSAPASSPMSRWRIRSARSSSMRWRKRRAKRAFPHRRGGTYLAMEGPQFSSLAESESLSRLGLRRDRHDQDARSQARPRGGDPLCHRRHGHRLRLLASGPRPRHGRAGDQGACSTTPTRRARWSSAWRRSSGPERTPSPLGIEHVLDTALITAPEKRDPELFAKLDAVAGRVLKTAR